MDGRWKDGTVARFGLWLCVALLAGCDTEDSEPVGPTAVEARTDRWDLTPRHGTLGALTGLAALTGSDAPIECETYVITTYPYGTGTACWCPATMHFDGAGGCECDNGGSGIDCDLSGDGGSTGEGGDPGDPGTPPGGPLDPHDPEDDEMRVTLSCPSTVTFGSSATCRLTKESPSDQLTDIGWRFMSVHIQTTPTQSEGETWSGTMVVDGTVVVDFNFNGSPMDLQQGMTVTPRSWSWSGTFSTGQASAGQFYGCFSPSTNLGQTVGTDCATSTGALLAPANPNFGYDLVPASGMNAGAGWFVKNPATTLSVRTQINQEFRSDGPAHPVVGPSALVSACTSTYGSPIPSLNTRALNSNCATSSPYTSQFGGFVSDIWTHEDLHMNAALSAAQNGDDLWARWANLLEPSESDLRVEVIDALNDVNVPIRDASKDSAIHPGLPTLTKSLWRWVGSVWDFVTVGYLGF